MNRSQLRLFFSASIAVALVGCSDPTAGSNAELSALTVSSGTLTPAFAASTLDYAVSVDNSVTSLTVTGTAADSTATVSANNGVAQSLSVGSNAVAITVTAQDGTTTKAYTVTATRAASTDTPSALTYTVTFSCAEATTAASPTARTVTTPATTIDALPTAPARTGYAFTGWWTAENGGGTEFTTTTAVTASLTVYANWTANSHTITFNPNGMTAAAYTQAMKTDETATLTKMTGVTPNDYCLAGWATTASAITAAYADGASYTMGTSDVTLYAVWLASSANFDYTTADGAVTIDGDTTSSITTLVIPNYIGGYPVTAIASEAFFNCYSLTSAVFPASLPYIGASAFGSCTALTSVIIPSSVTSLESSTFLECTSLNSVTIPASVTSIGYACFCKCYALTSVTIPSSVTSIGQTAFAACTSLSSVYINATTPPTILTNVFTYHPTDFTIYVPKSTGSTVLAAYKAATNWSTWADYIKEQP